MDAEVGIEGEEFAPKRPQGRVVESLRDHLRLGA
jgi:hypothetical protein